MLLREAIPRFCLPSAPPVGETFGAKSPLPDQVRDRFTKGGIKGMAWYCESFYSEAKNLRPFALLRVTYDSLAAGDAEDAHAAHEGAGMPALVVGYPQLHILELPGRLFGFALNLLVYLVDFPDAAGTDRMTE